MSGGIVVEGSDRLYPFLKGLTERVLLLKHHPTGRADYEELVTVNGTVAPTIPIRPGEAQCWQIGNIGAHRFLRLKIDGMPFYLLGRDGYFVPGPIKMDEVILGPGQRFSAIVVGGSAGRYAFKSVAFKFDERQPPLPEVNLGTVVSDGPGSGCRSYGSKGQRTTREWTTLRRHGAIKPHCAKTHIRIFGKSTKDVLLYQRSSL
jgi:hypothetical protein